MHEAIINIAMEAKKKYESSDKTLCSRGLEICDLTLIGSMTREFRRTRIHSFDQQATQEYTILELADTVKNVRFTFCGDTLSNTAYHKTHCGPQQDLGARVDNLLSGCKGLDLPSFR